MELLNRLRVTFAVFFGFIFSVIGVSKFAQAHDAQFFTGDKISAIDAGDSAVCRPESLTDNVSLFVSCSGFLE